MDEILNSVMKYFHLRAFFEQVLSGDNVLKIAFSYQSYAAVLKDLCAEVLQKVVDEEDIVKQQGIISFVASQKRKSSLL